MVCTGYVGHDPWGQPHPQERDIAELLSSFLPLNLSSVFLKDGPKKLNNTVEYERPTYLPQA
jgi:hypothetical protein